MKDKIVASLVCLALLVFVSQAWSEQGTNAAPLQPVWGASPIAEPYPYVSSGSYSGPAVPLSPDPLVGYRWPNPKASDGLEIYLQKPMTVTADTNASFDNLQSLTGNNPNVTVNGAGSIRMDFGQENAAWLEFDSLDLPNLNSVTMSIGEYNRPEITSIGPEANYVKTLKPTKYGNTYRLELNSELYEGVRFGWIHVNSFTSPWHISGVRLVCQTKPANYNGSFSCSDDLLTRIWYTGAYTVKLNLLHRISFSPFNQYFVIQAFAGMDKYDDALNSINDLWGSEINYGGTTFFEVSRPSWNAAIGTNDPVPNGQIGFTSLCHPWSVGVVKWLSEEVLGIKPTSPGFATYQILPHLGRTLTYVTGQTPTPLGNIKASFNVSNGLCTVSSPAGTIGMVGIPKVEKTINSITINGTLAWDGSFHPVAGIGCASEDSEFVYFTGVLSGTYSLSVSYGGSTPTYTAPTEQYAARFVKVDSTTSGNWGGVYGKDGYVLCNYNGNYGNISSLPWYVSSVNFYMNAMNGNSGLPIASTWASGTNDSRALAPDSNNQNPRNAAAYFTDIDIWYRNTMTFSINYTGTNNYQVALYFVDWDNQGRRLAVEMYDANSLDLVAPVKVITNFSGGEYLVYTYNKSAKFRINQVRGDNAVLSGIFFDLGPTNTAPVVPVVVGNPSFEITVPNTYHANGWNTLPKPGAWVGGGSAFDTLNPALGGHFSQVPDGTNCCYLVQTGPISQDLHVTINAGQTVTLAFYEGRANDSLGTSISSLNATIMVGNQSFITNFNDSTITAGTLMKRSFSWTAKVGGDLKIAFANVANNSFLDNVSVNITPQPQLGAGLANNNLLVSWGLGADGFRLYSTTNLLQWTLETPVLATNLNGISTLLPVRLPCQFFRLQQ